MYSRSKVKKGVQFMISYKDGVMVVPDEHDREESEQEGNKQKESVEEEEEGEGEERDSEEEGESEVDPAEEFGSDLESEVDSEQEEGEREVQDSFERVDHSSSTDKEKRKVVKAATKELPYTFKSMSTVSPLVDTFLTIQILYFSAKLSGGTSVHN